MSKRNAIILAAGTSSRFVPLSFERPKGLICVKGEILIERQIRQLREAGVDEITLVTGYMSEAFDYLRDKYGVSTVFNPDYARFNNSSSMMCVLDRLGNTFICSSDNYFSENVFKAHCDSSYYSALYAAGPTDEYCLSTDSDDNITGVSIGGCDSWYMIGHVYFNSDFSGRFKDILTDEYWHEETRQGYWEDVYLRHIGDLPKMKINRYGDNVIREFDSLDELRLFDESYRENCGSGILAEVARRLSVSQSELYGFRKELDVSGFRIFSFNVGNDRHLYNVDTKSLLTL